jgi:hypothetical protein
MFRHLHGLLCVGYFNIYVMRAVISMSHVLLQNEAVACVNTEKEVTELSYEKVKVRTQPFRHKRN